MTYTLTFESRIGLWRLVVVGIRRERWFVTRDAAMTRVKRLRHMYQSQADAEELRDQLDRESFAEMRYQSAREI